MNTELKENYKINYINNFKDNPLRFANKLSNEQLKDFGVSNNDFWKSFIINLDEISNENFMEEEGIFKYLARIYFIQTGDKREYFIEKFPRQISKINEEILINATNFLEENNIVVDLKSAVLFNNQIKFSKYRITKE